MKIGREGHGRAAGNGVRPNKCSNHTGTGGFGKRQALLTLTTAGVDRGCCNVVSMLLTTERIDLWLSPRRRPGRTAPGRYPVYRRGDGHQRQAHGAM